MVQVRYNNPSQSRHITDPIKTFLLLTQRGSYVYKAKSGLCTKPFNVNEKVLKVASTFSGQFYEIVLFQGKVFIRSNLRKIPSCPSKNSTVRAWLKQNMLKA